MKEIKVRTVLLLLMIELTLFISYYCFGKQGLKSLQVLKIKSASLKHETCLLKEEINQLEKEIESWQNRPFYKEKFAREHLQMAYEKETLYCYSQSQS